MSLPRLISSFKGLCVKTTVTPPSCTVVLALAGFALAQSLTCSLTVSSRVNGTCASTQVSQQWAWRICL